VKEARRCGHGHESGALGSASGLTEEKDTGGIAAKVFNVVANPLESKDEIELPCVAGVPEEIMDHLRREVGEVEIAEEIEPMIQCDHDDVAAASETDAVVDRTVGGAGRVGSAVNIDQDGPLVTVESRSPEVQVEAILGVDWVGFVEWSEGRAALASVEGLRGLWAEGEAIADARPRWGPNRWSETGRGSIGSVGNALENENLLVGEAANFARGRVCNRRGLRVDLMSEQRACGQ
jgi:hypothetical protein